ncbi:hypothetical protein A1OO_08610 [Enterovibrio norvegicus FF-33]|nr:hypothetical protein A1OO_08610 [Enterovibrio norvegicus FF-33]
MSLADLQTGKAIRCAHGNYGRVFVIPLLNGEVVNNATGGIVCSVKLEGVEESIPDGEVLLSQTNPPTYDKPNWIGLADDLVVQADLDNPPTGVDAVKLVIERW